MKTYDPKAVICTVVSPVLGVHIVSGFVDGTFLSIERDEQKFTKRVGADGEVSRSKRNNLTATATFTLKQTSSSNDFFSALANLDDLSSDGVVSFFVKDGSGRTLVTSAEAWVETEAADSFGIEEEDRTWVIALASTQKFTGGN